jgi:Zn finger protein HypA/HybF involved in hydrogenase expression
MAQFQCGDCGHEDQFSEFKVGEVEAEHDLDDGVSEEEWESHTEDVCACPECGSSAVFEL